MNFYTIYSNVPWGDYGDILINGWLVDYDTCLSNPIEEIVKVNNLEHKIKTSEVCVLWRTGPSCPELSSFFKTIIIKESVKPLFERLFPYLGYNPVIKGKVVEHHWESWDITELPPYGPKSLEPEGFLLEWPHSPSVSDEVGNLFRLVTRYGCYGQCNTKNDPPTIDLFSETWNGDDIFYINRWPGLYDYFRREIIISERGKELLQDNNLAKYLTFEENCICMSGLPNTTT